MANSYQAIVIGSGPAGYVCGVRLGQVGVKAVVVEAGELGGVCLNVGCIPSKALITASKWFEKTRSMAAMGVVVESARVDMQKMQSWKSGVVKKLTSGVGTLLKGNGTDVVKGLARIKGPGVVEVTRRDGETVTLTAPTIIVATGSRPVAIPGFAFDHENVLDSTSGLDLAEVPKRVVVIGGGYIGLELGGTYARLGSKVTVVEMLDQLLIGFDLDLVRPVERALKKAGAEVLLKTKAKGWRKTDDGLVCEVEGPDGKAIEIACDKILVTVGRRPNSDGLGLTEAGVTIGKGGFVPVDARRETNVKGIYAIGDVAGNPMLAHKGMKEGEVAAEAIAGHPSAYDVRCVPAVVFTEPEIATVGLSEAEAKAAGHAVKVGKYPFAALGRSLTMNETEGFVRVVVEEKTKEILGVQVVGPEASELIAEAGLAIEMGAFADDVGLTIHAHPSLHEAMGEAAKAALGEAVHIINK